MKVFHFIFTSAAILFLSISAFSQDKDKLAPLPDNTALAESQAWLLKNINKNFGYGSVDDNVKISNLKFDGCQISYRVSQRYTDQKAALGDRPALGVSGATTAKDVSYSVYEDLSFDLKNINPSRIALDALPQPKAMQVITLETLGKKDAISFDRKGSTVRYNASGMRSQTMLPVKEKAGEQIAKGLMHVIKLCQAESRGK